MLPAKKRMERERYQREMMEAMEKAEQIIDPAAYEARKGKERIHNERKAEILRKEEEERYLNPDDYMIRRKAVIDETVMSRTTLIQERREKRPMTFLIVHSTKEGNDGLWGTFVEKWQAVFGRKDWDGYVEEKTDRFMEFNPQPAIDVDIHLPKLMMFSDREEEHEYFK